VTPTSVRSRGGRICLVRMPPYFLDDTIDVTIKSLEQSGRSETSGATRKLRRLETQPRPSKTPAREGGCSSDDEEMSDVDDDSDLPSIKEILKCAKSRQPQTRPPESVIDLTDESDDDDDDYHLVSPHRNSAGGSA
jgi:hypothetical protein